VAEAGVVDGDPGHPGAALRVGDVPRQAGGVVGVEPFAGREVTVKDVTSQALGVIVLKKPTHDVEINVVVIPRNTKVPAEHSTVVETIYDDQTEIDVRVTQGDDEDPAFVVEVGKGTMRLPAYPKGSPVRITYRYDIDQTIEVDVVDLVTNTPLGSFEVDRVANLTEAQVREAESKIRAITVN
jgi:molecular chaperone DnaK